MTQCNSKKKRNKFDPANVWDELFSCQNFDVPREVRDAAWERISYAALTGDSYDDALESCRELLAQWREESDR